MAPSWPLGAQVGAKRGKLTLFGGLRGTKLELKGALGAPKEAPKELQRVTTLIDVVATGLIFGPGGPPKVT